MSLCIAVIPPKQAMKAIGVATSQYVEHLNEKIPEGAWHAPLMEISAVPSQEPLRQAFHQTLRILSIGEGAETMSLSVRIQATPSLAALRESIQEHLKKQNILTNNFDTFTAHIYLGSFATIPAFGIIDTPLALTFSVQKLYIIQTEPYEVLGSIDIVS